jgi:transcriptional regulator with XRE-family HTH domain
MGIYDIFAANLRKHCSAFASIAEVCRGIGINRQQFNKYLAGQILPNSRTLRRISEYLGVSEVELFQDVSSPSSIIVPKPEFSAAQDFESVLRSFIPRLKRESEALKEGFYFCYFPLQNPNFLMRSLLKVSHINGEVSFKRITFIRSNTHPKKYLARGKHIGIVLGTSQEIYLLGTNRSSNQISLITIDRSVTAGAPVLQGMCLTRDAQNQLACRVMLEPIGSKINIKQAIRKLGLISIDDREIAPQIVVSLASNAISDGQQLTPINSENLMLSQ